MSIKQNIEQIEKELSPFGCKLIAVSKTKPVALIQEAYDAGMRHFGENKVQELQEKQAQLPADIHWHLIGHLQTNKVKYIAPFVSLIHAVDSLKLLTEINKQAEKHGRIIRCLLQIYIAQEETKFGLSPEEAIAIIESGAFREMQHIQICGLMGMATFTDDQAQIRAEFRSLKKLYDQLKNTYQLPNFELTELSMGMSGDYEIAMQEGSTMVRIGSAIFGGR